MIIDLNSTKDTYITNIKNSFNEGSTSNVGQASTLDVFKIASESKTINAKGIVNLLDTPQPGDIVIITNKNNISKRFEFNTNNQADINNIEVEISDNIVNCVDNLKNAINLEAFQITAYTLYDNIIMLVQDQVGLSGEKEIFLESNDNIIEQRIKKHDFVCFEHSALLINFDLSEFRRNHIDNYGNSKFSSNENFKAILRLRDVGQSSIKANNFKVKLNILKNDFKEGLGRDTIYFSDIDDANFVTINSKNNINWAIKDIVSQSDIKEGYNFTADIDSLDGDLVIDVTEYIMTQLSISPDDIEEDYNLPFVIHFDLDYLFDKYTYFVKRFGSRNLKNKFNSPVLQIAIKDNSFENILTSTKKRYFDNEETFYLTNTIGNSLKNFIVDRNIMLKIEYFSDTDNDNNTDKIDILNIDPILGNDIYNYKGSKVIGIKKFKISDNIISQIQEDTNFIKELSEKGFVNLNFKYYYNDINNTLIREELIKFYPPENNYDILSIGNKNIRVSLDILQNELYADDSHKKLKFSFIDINRQYDFVNVPINIKSEDLGDIFYSVYDVDSGNILIKEDNEYTKLDYDGEFYNCNFFVSKNFKNKRINFKFSYKNPITGLYQKIFNDNTIIRTN